MISRPTYNHNPAKLFFALAFLISLSFFPGVGSSTSPAFQQKTKTELVASYKVKTPDWIRSLHKKVNLKTRSKPPVLKNYEAGLISSYNRLIRIKFKYLTQNNSLIKSPDRFFRVKTIPQNSKENDFISFTG